MLRLHLTYRAKSQNLVMFCLLIFSLFSTSLVAEEILVITHRDTPVSNLSTKQVADLYLGLGQTNHGLVPFDMHDKKLRQNFYREVAGLSLASIRAKRAKQVFTGRGRPPAALRPEQVEQVLSEKPGAVIYVLSDQLPAGSKTLLTLKLGAQVSGAENE